MSHLEPVSGAKALERKTDYLNIRLPADIKARLRAVSEAESRTLAAQVLHFIKQGLKDK